MAKNGLPDNDLSYRLNGLAMKVHRVLGKGFLEVVYKDALEHELKKAGIAYEREKPYKVHYEDIVLGHSYNADFVVENSILLEVKAKRQIIEDHFRQTINYLAVSKIPLAIMYNFGEESLVIKRVAL